MGEAARRKAEILVIKAQGDIWLAGLSSEEKAIAAVAQRTYDGIVGRLGMTEGCYNLAFFLQAYLQRVHGIKVDVVVGWVNDGQWGGATSHAWIEYQGKKIDISLNKTSNPEAAPPGDMIILDRVVHPGKVSYTYWPTLPDHAAAVLSEMAADHPEVGAIIDHKNREHERMQALARMPGGADLYFKDAPPNCSYSFLAGYVV
ncbi:hypothetical protein [Vogesella sp. XCS3]|uniref:hypothetical protein n=1 Tax=Vogesella sp. XCS3 TaxID=2877939 RepID=UPI001D0A66A7|nr:hypothetical protein [Vogesella sp. XCS3]UDM18913.1 hypothetical protein LCH97_17875 [Vogesella sp. XCS3]